MLEQGVDYFETYAPVVSWSTVRLLLTLSITLNLKSHQVDYNNAFAQADMPGDVFIEIPQDFTLDLEGDYVLRLKKSLYGHPLAPKLFFEHLKKGLLSHGFIPSAIEPCLFLHPNGMVLLCYVDDCVLFHFEIIRSI